MMSSDSVDGVHRFRDAFTKHVDSTGNMVHVLDVAWRMAFGALLRVWNTIDCSGYVAVNSRCRSRQYWL